MSTNENIDNFQKTQGPCPYGGPASTHRSAAFVNEHLAHSKGFPQDTLANPAPHFAWPRPGETFRGRPKEVRGEAAAPRGQVFLI
jgi:hypothetical protein